MPGLSLPHLKIKAASSDLKLPQGHSGHLNRNRAFFLAASIRRSKCCSKEQCVANRNYWTNTISNSVVTPSSTTEAKIVNGELVIAQP